MRPALQTIRAFAAALVATVALISGAGTAAAQPGPRFDPRPPAARTSDVAAELKEISIKDRAGNDVPKDVPLVDQDGKPVKLGDYFDGKHPVVLALAYYECPMLCSLVLTGVLDALKPLKQTAGEDYRVVVVSFDPRDTPQRAALKRGNYIDAYGRKVGPRGWDFLVGKGDDVRRIADAVGFTYRWDEKEKQFAHSAGAFVLTPEGRVSRTLYGLSFPEMRLALLEASEGKIGTVTDRVLLFCFHYDPGSRGYVLATVRIMKAGGTLTLLLLGAFLLRHWRSERRRRSRDEGGAIPATGPGEFLPERRS
jgi:protein SCO1